MKGGRPLPGAVELPPGARLTTDEFADLVLRPAALSNDSPRPGQDDDGRA